MISPVEYGFMVFWFIVVIAAIVNYAMLDGFDLGVGMLLLCTKEDRHRRICINAIGPVWDGNELWLVIVMGALFAGFPLVYAKLLSAFNTPIMLLVFSLIFRAVAIEFRSKRPGKGWRKTWDCLFFLASLMIAFSVGVSLGNFVEGIPLDENFNYTGGVILTFLRPYPILIGILAISLFSLHGAIYLAMKTEDELHDKVTRWIKPALILFLILYVVATAVTLIYQTHMINRFIQTPWFFIIPAVNLLVIAWIPRCIVHNHFGWAFLSSCASIALLIATFACGLFPELIHSSIDPAYSLTITNSSSSYNTLFVLMIIVAIGLPLVIAYMSWIYHIFRGKVVLDDHSY